MDYAAFLAKVKLNAKGSCRNRISTADRYLATLQKCTGGLCPTDRAKYDGAGFQKVLKEAAQKSIYTNDLMNPIGFKSGTKGADGSPAPVAVFDAVYTSTKQDRDSDILESKGADIDPRMPLLWQHDPLNPIGKHVKTLGINETNAMGQCAIADIPLGRDAAYLAEFGALRLSHGFKPKKYEPITEKSGGVEHFIGFHVLEYEMMEISLVSVPSNTDAVITALHRSKLCSPVMKSWAGNLDSVRRRVYTTNLGLKAFKPTVEPAKMKRVPATGVKRPLVNRVKDVTDFEAQLAQAASQVIHSGDYGLCFYKAGATDGAYSVWYTMGDADGAGGATDDGTPFTSEDDIKAALGAVQGVSDVQIGPEANPPYDEGWREVYPDVKDWVSAQDQAASGSSGNGSSGSGSDTPAPATDGAAAGQAGHKPTGSKGEKPVAGSFEAIALALNEGATEYLTSQGVQIDEGLVAEVEATYPGYVIVAVGEGNESDESSEVYYQISYSLDGAGVPTFSGPPTPVELELTVTDAPNPDGLNPPAPTGDGTGTPPPSDPGTPPPSGTSTTGKRKAKAGKWVKRGTAKGHKGRLGKKDSGNLKEAVEHFDDAMRRDGMPTVCKTLVKRGMDLVNEVIKSDGKPDPNDPAQDTIADMPQATGFDPATKTLWDSLSADLKQGVTAKNRLAVAFKLAQLVELLKAADLAEALKAAEVAS